MNSAEHKAVVRDVIDGAWTAFEGAIAAGLDTETAETLIGTCRSLVTAERALVDGNISPPADADFAEIVRRARERLGR